MTEISITIAGITTAFTVTPAQTQKILDAQAELANRPGIQSGGPPQVLSTPQLAERIAERFMSSLVEGAASVERQQAARSAMESIAVIPVNKKPK
jgi:hypothetical protein